MKKLLSLAVLATALAGCGNIHPLANAVGAAGVRAQNVQSFPPVIEYVTANGIMGMSFTAPPNCPITFMCWATGSSPLTYQWTGWGPILGFGQTANWTSPMTAGTYDLQVWVRDMQGMSAWRDIWVQVQPQAQALATANLSAADKANAIKPSATGTSN